MATAGIQEQKNDEGAARLTYEKSWAVIRILAPLIADWRSCVQKALKTIRRLRFATKARAAFQTIQQLQKPWA